jgi:hypothetical protein
VVAFSAVEASAFEAVGASAAEDGEKFALPSHGLVVYAGDEGKDVGVEAAANVSAAFSASVAC